MREGRLPEAGARANIIENDRAKPDQRMRDSRKNDEDYDQG